MKVAGQLVRDYRVRSGMSQRELASGICAQATVSLIENQNNCPNLEILHPICYRLNLNLKSIIKVTQGVRDVELAMINHDYYRANQIFKRISKRKFKDHRHMGCYYCYQGIFSLIKSDYFNALYFFNKVISINIDRHDVFYQAWANLGLSIVYFQRRDPEKSLEFVQFANQKFNLNKDQKLNDRFKLVIQLRLRISSLLYTLNQIKLSNQTNYKTISILVDSHSMYHLADAYRQLNRNYIKLNYRKHARLARKRAQMFDSLYRKPKSL